MKEMCVFIHRGFAEHMFCGLQHTRHQKKDKEEGVRGLQKYQK